MHGGWFGDRPPARFNQRNKMDPVTSALLIDLVIIPVIKNLAARRRIDGVTTQVIKDLINDPKKALTRLERNPKLLKKVNGGLADIVEHIAGSTENIIGSAIDMIVNIFTAIIPGKPEE